MSFPFALLTVGIMSRALLYRMPTLIGFLSLARSVLTALLRGRSPVRIGNSRLSAHTL